MPIAARAFGMVVGFAYVLFGVVGFAYTGFLEWFVAHSGSYLLPFRLNPTLNLVHFALGAVFMVAATEPEPVARVGVAATGALFLALGITGFVLIGNPAFNILAINQADAILHLSTGVAAFAAAVRSRRSRRRMGQPV